MNLECYIVESGYALDELTVKDKDGSIWKVDGQYLESADGFVVHVTELRIVSEENDMAVIVELDV